MSMQVGAAHSLVLGLQKPLMQSAVTTQALPSMHFGQVPPPQSTSVSLPSFTAFMQAETQTLPMQKVLTQSVPALHALPFAHFVAHVPPQSTSDSVPSFLPSMHM